MDTFFSFHPLSIRLPLRKKPPMLAHFQVLTEHRHRKFQPKAASENHKIRLSAKTACTLSTMYLPKNSTLIVFIITQTILIDSALFLTCGTNCTKGIRFSLLPSGSVSSFLLSVHYHHVILKTPLENARSCRNAEEI